VPPYYDSLLAKLVAHGRDRQEAIVRARRALQMLRIDGVKTSISLHQRVLDDRDFVAGRLSTVFMDRYLTRS
jgi:acetyl-CoA carboxylase biotin carboxylase subunit